VGAVTTVERSTWWNGCSVPRGAGHPSLTGPSGQLPGQRGLADARFSRDEEEAAAAADGVLETGREFSQFDIATDEGMRDARE